MVNNGPATLTTKTATATQRNHQVRHSTPIHFSDSLFRNKRLKQKRLKWALAISKGACTLKNNKCKKTDYRRRCGLVNLPPDITINLLSDDEYETKQMGNHTAYASAASSSKQHQQNIQQQSLPQLVVFPTHLQISKKPNITLIPVKPLPPALAATLQLTCNKQRKRKSQKPKRLSEPTIINKESIVLSDESDDDYTNVPVACSTPNHLLSKPISPAQTVATAITPLMAQVDEEVTVSLVPRSTAAGSCSSMATKPAVIFPMVPDETTVQTIISNRIYELSLTKLREGLASSGVGDFNEEKRPYLDRRTNFNLPPKLQEAPPPVALKLSSDLSISLISDDEDDHHHIDPEKLLRQQPHLSVRPVGVVTVHRPPKRRKLG